MKSEFSPSEEKRYPRLLQSETIIILANRYNKNDHEYEGTVVHVINHPQAFSKLGLYGNFNASKFVDCYGSVTLEN